MPFAKWRSNPIFQRDSRWTEPATGTGFWSGAVCRNRRKRLRNRSYTYSISLNERKTAPLLHLWNRRLTWPGTRRFAKRDWTAVPTGDFRHGVKLVKPKDLQNLRIQSCSKISGWWLSPTPLKNDGVRQLGWRYSQLNGKIKHVPNHQPDFFLRLCRGLCCPPFRWRSTMLAPRFNPENDTFSEDHITVGTISGDPISQAWLVLIDTLPKTTFSRICNYIHISGNRFNHPR